MVLLVVAVGALADIPQLYLVALSALSLLIMIPVCLRIAATRGLAVSVYLFVGTIYLALTPSSLFVSGLLPMMVLDSVLLVILIGLFVSPQLVLREGRPCSEDDQRDRYRPASHGASPSPECSGEAPPRPCPARPR